jgi:hypothetical protein
MKFGNKNFTKKALISLVAFYAVIFSLNPKLIQIYLHEYAYHRKGLEVSHIHSDFSLHAIINHFLDKTKEVSLKLPAKILVTDLSVWNLESESAEHILFGFCGLLILYIFLAPRKYIHPLFNLRARSPPSFQ